MAIKSSGSLAMSEIATEWGGSTAHSISEYYSNGAQVWSGAQDEAGNTIPSSGTISFSDFYSTPTISTGSGTATNFTSDGTYTIPFGAATLQCYIHGGGGQGGEGDESGSGGAGGGGGSGCVVQGTLTISNNSGSDYSSGDSQQTVTVTVGSGGEHAGSNNASYIALSTVVAASGEGSTVVYGGQTTSAGGGGYGGGFKGNGVAYVKANQGSNTIGSNFSITTASSTGNAADDYQGGSGDGFSSNGTAGKALHANPLSITSTGGTAGSTSGTTGLTGTINGQDASGYGAGGGGAASKDRDNITNHWFGGAGAPGYVRIQVAS